MMESLRQSIPYLLTGGICAALIEIILSALWSPCYFSWGIPIYRRRITLKQGVRQLPTAAQLETALPKNDRIAPLLIRPINENRLAFREKLFHFGVCYSPVMRGSITCKPATGELDVRGYLNWYLLVFVICLVLYLVTSPFEPVAVVILFCFLVVLCYIYRTQERRFSEVENALRKLWKE